MSNQTPPSETSTTGEPLSLDALLVYIDAAPTAFHLSRGPQLGLYYLAQHAVDAGYTVRVDSLSANDYVAKRLARLIEEHSCPLLGFYVDQDNIWDLRRILPTLKQQRPDVEIIIGGPQVTGAPELTLDRLPEALVGVVGEGEETFVELLSLPAMSPEALRSCQGLVLRNSSGAEFTPTRPLIDPLDSLARPRRRELNLEPDAPVSRGIITGRGCHGRCAFCYEGSPSHRGKRLRLHSAERCLEEFDYLVTEFDHGYVCILDDSFVAHPQRLREFCQGLIQRYRGEKKWFCEARVDTLTRHPDLLPLMIEAGLIRIQVGGESGDQCILDAYRKGTTLDQLVEVVEAAKAHGLLSMYANFIVGGAFETRETFEKTRDFAVELLHMAPGILGVGKSFYTPYPGTPMYDDPAAYGLIVVDQEGVTGMGDKHVFCRTEELSRFDILEMGYDFEQSIHQTMTSLSKQLPYDVIERQFRAYYAWNITTEWHDRLSEDPLIYSYLRSVLRAGAKTLTEAREANFVDMYPMRHVGLVATIGDHYVIHLPLGDRRELDALESRIIELSTGKLTLDDIVGIVQDRTPDIDPVTIRRAIVERFARFDREFLVVWRTNVL